MSKPRIRVLTCVLCGSQAGQWVHPLLAKNLIEVAADERFDVEIEMVIDRVPVDHARNYAMTLARKRNVDYLLMIDHDQSFELSPLDALNEGLGKDVLVIPTMQSVDHDRFAQGEEPLYPNFRTFDDQSQRETDGPFFTVKAAGTGAIFIRRLVWERMKGPWFRTIQDDSETAEVREGEDFYFTRAAREAGFKIWCYHRLMLHHKTSEITRLGVFFQAAKEIGNVAAKAGIPQPNRVAFNIQAKGAAR